MHLQDNLFKYEFGGIYYCKRQSWNCYYKETECLVALFYQRSVLTCCLKSLTN